jgi:hypothetical protein
MYREALLFFGAFSPPRAKEKKTTPPLKNEERARPTITFQSFHS